MKCDYHLFQFVEECNGVITYKCESCGEVQFQYQDNQGL